MKSKRMLFVLFTCVFALYGCVNSQAVSLDTGKANKRVSMDTTNSVQSVSQVFTTDFQRIALQAYGQTLGETSMFTKLRDTAGILIIKSDMNSLSKELLANAKLQQAQKAAEEKKKVALAQLEKESNAVFTPKITTYGLDCDGCQAMNGRGGTSMGVALDLSLGVQQSDGSWKAGIQYGDYFIIAADPSIPMCSIVKISDHGLSGSGIVLDQPFYAMVLDRGGGIGGNHFDLYVGTQYNSPVYRINQGNPKAEIIRSGGSCSL